MKRRIFNTSRKYPKKRYTNKFEEYQIRVFNNIKGWIGVLDGNSYYALRDLINSAEKEILIITYQIKADIIKNNNTISKIIGIIKSKKLKGVEVKILINKKYPINYMVDIAEKSKMNLKKEGLEVKTYKRNKTLHSKLIIIDKERIYIGSHNLTNTALLYNCESGIIIDNKDIANFFESYFNKLWSEGE